MATRSEVTRMYVFLRKMERKGQLRVNPKKLINELFKSTYGGYDEKELYDNYLEQITGENGYFIEPIGEILLERTQGFRECFMGLNSEEFMILLHSVVEEINQNK